MRSSQNSVKNRTHFKNGQKLEQTLQQKDIWQRNTQEDAQYEQSLLEKC